MGHHVQIIARRFVKPFVKSQKNDRNDAEAITEAASRPTMRYVAINSVEQQDIQSMHRIRSLPMQTGSRKSTRFEACWLNTAWSLPRRR